MENERRIKEFNRTHRPFYIVDQDDGAFSLCLPFDLLEGKYANYCQEAFDNYARSIGDPLYTSISLKTHGNGYEWEAAFRQTFRNDPDIGRVIFIAKPEVSTATVTVLISSKALANDSKRSVRTPNCSRK